MSRGDLDDLFSDLERPGEENAGQSSTPTEGFSEAESFTWRPEDLSEPAARSDEFPETAPPPEEEPQEPEAPQPEEEEEKEAKPKKPGIFARLAQTSPYVVMLFLSLVALIIGTLILGVELWRYQFEIKPPS